MNEIKVGVGLYILNNESKLLLGLRKSKHGNGTWSPPGGHLEFGESFEEAAIRETKEETSIDINKNDIKIIETTNDIYKETDKHYITIHMVCRKYFGEAKITEPDKCERWEWFSLDNLPDNIFLSTANFFRKNKIF